MRKLNKKDSKTLHIVQRIGDQATLCNLDYHLVDEVLVATFESDSFQKRRTTNRASAKELKPNCAKCEEQLKGSKPETS